jgi:heterodisulfide reductase subunit C
MEKPIDSVITTCGHSAVCLQCGTRLTQCPICRNPFNQEQIIKLYNVH